MKRFDDVLRDLRIPFQTEGSYCRPGWIQFQCPFCHGGRDPNKPYAGFNIAFQYVHCWRCGPHPVIETVQRLGELNWREAKDLVGDLESQRKQKIAHSGTLKLPKGLYPLQPAHRRYLKGREFSPAEIERLWHVQGIGIASRLSWRIWIPIYFHGDVVSWTTRSLTDQEPRYVSAAETEESLPHKSLLYGEDYATNAISIHEGPFDVWRIGPGAVATMGVSYTPAQVLRMSRFPRRIVCFDSEPAAQKRALRLCDELAAFDGETFNLTLTAKDAGVSEAAEVAEVRGLLSS